MDLREIDCDGDSWTELAQNSFQWQVLVLKLLKFRLSYPSVVYEHISCFEVIDFSSFNYR
jgi:hypothetical protein